MMAFTIISFVTCVLDGKGFSDAKNVRLTTPGYGIVCLLLKVIIAAIYERVFFNLMIGFVFYMPLDNLYSSRSQEAEWMSSEHNGKCFEPYFMYYFQEGMYSNFPRKSLVRSVDEKGKN